MHADKHKCTYAHLTRYLKKKKKKNPVALQAEKQ